MSESFIVSYFSERYAFIKHVSNVRTMCACDGDDDVECRSAVLVWIENEKCQDKQSFYSREM